MPCCYNFFFGLLAPIAPLPPFLVASHLAECTAWGILALEHRCHRNDSRSLFDWGLRSSRSVVIIGTRANILSSRAFVILFSFEGYCRHPCIAAREWGYHEAIFHSVDTQLLRLRTWPPTLPRACTSVAPEGSAARRHRRPSRS